MNALGELAGKRAIVTGGCGGIGSSICQELALRGARVIALDRPSVVSSKGLQGEMSCQSEVVSIGVDLEHEYLNDEYLRMELSRTDILVNAAGVLYTTRFGEITRGEWQRTFQIGVDSYFFLSQLALPGMMDRSWGRIVNISSTAGKSVSTLGGVHYTASKAAVLGLTRALALEVADRGVTVNAVCPGLFKTKMTSVATDSVLDDYAKSFPIPRLGRPEEVAHAVAFLCEPRAGYITGAALDINGGDLMV